MPATRFPPLHGDPSPWGRIEHVEPLGPDACFVSTASHGGVRVSPSAMARIPSAWRATAYSRDGWFEEDCDWCIPYLALGLHAFEPDAERGRRMPVLARDTFRREHGDPAAVEPASVTTGESTGGARG